MFLKIEREVVQGVYVYIPFSLYFKVCCLLSVVPSVDGAFFLAGPFG